MCRRHSVFYGPNKQIVDTKKLKYYEQKRRFKGVQEMPFPEKN